MRRRKDGHWDCRADAHITEPYLKLGGFVLEDAAVESGKPTEGFSDRLDKAIQDFIENLQGQVFEETH